MRKLICDVCVAFIPLMYTYVVYRNMILCRILEVGSYNSSTKKLDYYVISIVKWTEVKQDRDKRLKKLSGGGWF